MKLLVACYLVLIATVISSFGQTQDEVLTNESIISLVKSGISSNIIVSKIKVSITKFDVSLNELVSLKNNNVSDEVINAMVESSGNSARDFSNSNNPTDPHESGIYYIDSMKDSVVMYQIEPTVCTQSKTGSALGSALTYGAASVKMKGSIDGGISRNQLRSNLPLFYFYFQSSSADLGNTGWNSQSTSPSEFVLIKMTAKQKTREFITGKMNSWSGSAFGFDEKQRVDFEFVKLKPGIYKVVPKAPLLKGEYCFIYAGGGTTMGVGAISKVYDFGVTE